MKRLFHIYSILALIIIFSTNTYAQMEKYEIRYDTITVEKTKTIKLVTVRTVPVFILQLNGSFNSGALELQGHNGGFNKNDFLNGKTYGARIGFGVNLTGKLRLHRKGNFWLNVVTGFSGFKSDYFADRTDEGAVVYNHFSWGVGMDYFFTPADKVKYFVGGNILGSLIYGTASIPYDITIYDPIRFREVKINNAFRLGYSLYAGLEYAFEKNFGLNFGFKFTHANLFLKKTEVPTSDNEAHLNDDSSSPPVLYGGWKQFAYGSVFAGISYYFGVREKRYKLPEGF
jgi:opacity protein-like surface antigen